MGVPYAAVISLTHSTLHAQDLSNAASIQIPALDEPSTAVTVDEVNHRIVEGLHNGAVVFRDAATFTPFETLHSPDSSAAVSALAFSIASTQLATGFEDGSIILRDMQCPHIVTATLPMQSSPILSLSFHPSASPRYIAVQTAHAIAIISTSNYRQLARLCLPSVQSRSYNRTPSPTAKMTACAFSPLHTSLLAASDDTGCISVWDVSKHFVVRSKTNPDLTDSSVHSRFTPPLRAPAAALAFTPDGALAVGGFDKQLRFYDSDLTKLLFAAAAPAPISALAFRSGRAVAGLTDGSLALIDCSISDKFATFTKRIHLSVSSSAPSVAVRAVFITPPITKNTRDLKFEGSREKPTSANSVKKHTASSSVVQNTLSQKSTQMHSTRVPNLPTVAFETTLNLESIDDLLSGRAQGDSSRAPKDADLFSPVSKRSPPARRVPPLLDDNDPFLKSKPRVSVERRSQSVQDFLKNESNLSLDDESVDQFITPSRAKNSKPTLGQNFRETMLFSSSITDEFGLGSVDEYVIQGKRKNTPPRALEGSPSSGQSSSSSIPGRAHQKASFGGPTIAEPMSQSAYGQGRLDSFNPESVLKNSPQSSHNSQNSRYTAREIGVVPSRVRPSAIDGGLEPKATSTNEVMSLGPVSGVDQQLDVRRDFAGPNGEMSNPKAVSAETVISELTTAVRETIKLEMDERLTDLRNDILNIHSEMVVMESRRAEELRAVVLERDELVQRLRSEVSKLQDDNDRLRRKYGLG